jgi:hypothetical protein
LLDYIEELAPPVTAEEAASRRRLHARPKLRLAMAIVAALVVLAGALLLFRSFDESVPPATSPESTDPASFADLAGEWRATPLVLSGALLEEMEAKCIDGGIAEGASVMVADARGEGIVFLILERDDGAGGTCQAELTSDGDITAAAYATWARRPRLAETSAFAEPPNEIPPEPTEIRVHGGPTSPGSALPEDRWMGVFGEAGSEIRQIVAYVPDMSPIVASLRKGWFTLWTPVEEHWGFELVGFDREGNRIAHVLWP